jgi:hypothetical protein
MGLMSNGCMLLVTVMLPLLKGIHNYQHALLYLINGDGGFFT